MMLYLRSRLREAKKTLHYRNRKYGVLAQLGEHLPYKQRVIGSSPIGPIILTKDMAR